MARRVTNLMIVERLLSQGIASYDRDWHFKAADAYEALRKETGNPINYEAMSLHQAGWDMTKAWEDREDKLFELHERVEKNCFCADVLADPIAAFSEEMPDNEGDKTDLQRKLLARAFQPKGLRT